MKDRFTQAYAELTDTNPYICTTCETKFGHPTIEQVGNVEGDGRDLGTKGAECIFNCDPMPFGD